MFYYNNSTINSQHSSQWCASLASFQHKWYITKYSWYACNVFYACSAGYRKATKIKAAAATSTNKQKKYEKTTTKKQTGLKQSNEYAKWRMVPIRKLNEYFLLIFFSPLCRLLNCMSVCMDSRYLSCLLHTFSQSW